MNALISLVLCGCLLSVSALYTVTVTRLSNLPLLTGVNSPYEWVFNAALYSSPATGEPSILARCQDTGGASVLCKSSFTNPEFTSATPITPESVVVTPQGDSEKCGVEDPRIGFYNVTGGGGPYYVFYTAYGCSSYHLALAHTTDPGNPAAFTRLDDNIFSGQAPYGQQPSKSGAPHFRVNAPPTETDKHALLWGDNSNGYGISLGSSVGYGTYGWQVNKTNWLSVRPAPAFDSNLVEAGPPPLSLSDGNYLFLYNSAQTGHPSVKKGWDLQYNVGFVILGGPTDPPTTILQRSNSPILSPTLAWEVGNTTAYQTPNVVFVEGMLPLPGGAPNTFLIVYGAADSSLGVAKVVVSGSLDD